MKKFRKILFAAAAIVAAFAAVRVCILLDKLEFIKGAVEKNIQADMRAADEYLKGIDTVFDAYEKNVRAALDSKPKWRALYRYATFDGQGAERLFGEHFRQNIIESERQRWENLWDDFEYSLAKNANSLSMKLGVGLGGGASERGIFAQDISFESSAAVSSACKSISVSFAIRAASLQKAVISACFSRSFRRRYSLAFSLCFSSGSTCTSLYAKGSLPS